MERQDFLREYARLNRERKGNGLTPLEYLRWQDLKAKLEKSFPGRPAPGSGGKALVAIEYATTRELVSGLMSNVKPIGLFVRTPFAPEPGERFDLRVTLGDREGPFTGNVSVVSNSVGPGFSTADMGMGVRVNDQGSLFKLLMGLSKSAPS